MTGDKTILVVDDDTNIADLYTMWLEPEYDVRTAYGGDDALEQMGESVELVVLDRRMPEVAGDEVLETIREEGFDCPVLLVTAVDPEFNIVELPFDAYLTKPVLREDLTEMVETLFARKTDETHREYYALQAKKEVLEAERTPAELRHSDLYENLTARINQIVEDADSDLDADRGLKVADNDDIERSTEND